MDLKPVEAALTEVGKAFRLCRLYPATHPSVRQALAELAAALPPMTAHGAIELRIGTAGMLLGASPVAVRNPQLQEFASLLYAQGYRQLTVEPGVTAEEFGALVRMAASAGSRQGHTLGAQPRMQPLPHLHLEVGHRKSAATPRPEAATAGHDTPSMGRRSMSVFRPDAMPPEIEATRLVALLEHAAAGEAPRHLGRLAELAADLLAQRDMGGYARSVASLARWSRVPDSAEAVQAAQAGLAAAVTSPGLAALVTRLTEPGVAPVERDGIVQSLGVLGARAVPFVVDAYTAANPEQRDLLLGVVRIAGEVAVAAIEPKLDGEEKGEMARGLAAMLGATRHPRAVPGLVALARHAEAAVRAAAIAGLARMESTEAERTVVGAMRDRDPLVRVAAARGLSWFADAGVVPIVLANLATEEDADVLKALAGALGELRDPRAVNPLAELARGISGVFQRHPPPVRAAAVRALGALGTDDALAHVASFRVDRTAEVRQAAEEALQ